MKPFNKALSRFVENFNFGWKFFKGDSLHATQINYNDEDWREIDLPHDWSIRLLVYIQSLDRTGKGKILLTSSGMKDAELTIDVVEDEI